MAKKSGNRKPAKAKGSQGPSQAKRDAGQPAVSKRAKSSEAIGAKANSPSKRFPIVGLGASAGGLEAFTEFLKALRNDTGMGFVLIQHMDPTHESILASLLQRSTKMPIREATDGTVVEPNRVYILPPASLMTISNGVLSLTPRGPRSFKNYPIDQFFISLAEDLKHQAIGVILSGTASDGTRGLLAIKAEGGIAFAQDPKSARFSSMPASAVASGCIDLTLPPEQIAEELSRINGHPYILRAPPAEVPAIPAGADGFRKILGQLRIATRVDFELYKPAMIGRRIARRMALQKMDTHEQYLELIKKDHAELGALYEDIFIHVTGFFRDPESMQALQKSVLASFVPGKSSRSIRIWVPGCSSGEEVYSIAILLFETLSELRAEASIQIFGTDISERSIQRARAGTYPPSSMVDVSPERQKRFFSRIDGNFQVVKAIRNVCLFARHDVCKDPPFSRMDLISCRNVLIYMGPGLQKKLIEGFHYALKPGGYLFLGKSESLNAYSTLFATQDSKHKILVRRPLESPSYVHTSVPEMAGTEKAPTAKRAILPISDMRREAEQLLLGNYAPAALVVDSALRIVHFQGNTGRFLAPASGEPSFHLLRMIRPEFVADLRTAVYQAKKEGATVRREHVRFKPEGKPVLVDIDVSPMKRREGDDQYYMVVFRESPTLRPERVRESAGSSKDRSNAELASAEREIGSLREQLRDLVQDHETADQEMWSMNEEIVSSNEELESTNEELETAKEELESTNEELITLNDELQKRNADLSQLNHDLNHVLVAMDIPMVLLDSKLRIRRFTPAAAQVLNLITADMGRPLSDIAAALPSVNWNELAAAVTRIAQPIESEVQDREGRWYTLRVRPYQSSQGELGGFMISLRDIELVKRTLEEAGEVRRRAQDLEARLALAGEGLRIGMWELDIASDETRGSKQWAELFGFETNSPVTLEVWMQRVHPEDRAMVQEDLKLLKTSGKAMNREYRVIWPDGSMHWLNRRAELVRDAKGYPSRIRGVSIDISDQKTMEQERQALASRISSAQESERRRIARELHDSLIQELAAVAMDLGRRVTQSPTPDDVKKDYQSLQNRVVKAAEAARHVAYELHPTELDDLGLEKALRAYCEDVSQQNGIAVDFASRKVPSQVKREIASSLYKVAQEALRNVVKHSKAKKAKVTLETTDGHIRLCVEDNGAGFELSLLPRADGLGVASMRERIQLVNGKFSIASQPGEGTQVVVEVALKPRPGEGNNAR